MDQPPRCPYDWDGGAQPLPSLCCKRTEDSVPTPTATLNDDGVEIYLRLNPANGHKLFRGLGRLESSFFESSMHFIAPIDLPITLGLQTRCRVCVVGFGLNARTSTGTVDPFLVARLN